ncbi:MULTISPECIES: response regulator [unclassified Polaribacter]|uniref:response regulator n=1 Tax=unclassified Polaribacter TaxID=196858 RepID=UPI0011BEC6BF|nr:MULTISPECIES: response regulator [unclassified Polaribacter]TXD51539.1 response regulator transcription factor [Polaribacter sp. IC063]TXD56225.1 response regulator transcription factor [Polaribacter sp. IC066]
MNAKIKIIIVEDNVIIADDLKYTLENLGYLVVNCSISFEDAISFLEKNTIDLAFLDISLSTKKTGIDLANHINERVKIPFIYLTSNDDDATISLAAKTKPNGYLVKPFNANNLKASIEIAIKNYVSLHKNLKEDFIFVKKNSLYQRVFINDISYIKSDNIYLELHCANHTEYLLRSTLKSFIKKLPDYFIQCHKSYVVNLHGVTAFFNKSLVISDQEVPISSQFKNSVKNFMEKNK